MAAPVPDLGWLRLGSIFALPHGRKAPPPTGWTGIGAPYPDHDTQEAELIQAEPCNWGLRLRPGFLGIDVDAYHGGLETLEGLQAKLGPLPRGPWSSSGRGDGSAILYYRVPEGRLWLGSAGEGVDIIQPSHRYAVLPPSLHPEGRTYVGAAPYHGDEGQPPELPPEWVDCLCAGVMSERSASARPLAHLPVDGFADTWAGMADMKDALCIPADGRHDRLVKIAVRASHLWKAKYLTAATISAMVQAWWQTAMDDRSRLSEARRAVLWALAQRQAEMAAPPPPPIDRDPTPPSEAIRVSEPEPEDEDIDWMDWADDSVPTRARWHIDKLVPVGKIGSFFGASTVGKSLLALAVGVKLARSGVEVAYLDCEMAKDDQRQRMAAYEWLEAAVADGWAKNLRMGFPKRRLMLDLLEGDAETLRRWAGDAEVVILDSVTKFIGGEEDAIRTWETVHAAVASLGRTVLYIDHEAKHDQRQRGSSGKLNNLDLAFRVTRGGEGIGWNLECTKQRFSGADKIPEHQTYLLTPEGHFGGEARINPGAAIGLEQRLVNAFDSLGVDADWSDRKIADALRPHKLTFSYVDIRKLREMRGVTSG